MWQFDGPSRDWDELLQAVTALRSEVDWVVVTLHWGPNWVDAWPIDWMPELGEALVDAGASVVHGHSAHHVLPIDRVRGVPVLYGSGDFLDDYGPREGYRNDLGYLARVRLVPDAAPELEIVPLRIEHDAGDYVHPLDPEDPDHALVMHGAGLP